MAVEPVVICLSRAGEAVAHRIGLGLGVPVHGRLGRVGRADVHFQDAAQHLRDLFAAGVPLIGICASGILIRALAPLLADKMREPPVLSVSDDGAAVVPLLGGHRGANMLARRVAKVLGTRAAVTTAGDVVLGASLDEPPEGWVLATPGSVKGAMAALLSGARVNVTGNEARGADWLAGLPAGAPGGAGEVVEIVATTAPPPDGALTFHPQRATLGVGCARNCPAGELEALVLGALEECELAPGALKAIFTLDLKADEVAVNALAAKLGLPVRLFSAAELEAETPRLENPSDVVFAEVGCHGVAEAAALAGGGPGAHLGSAKTKSANATCAIGLAPEPITQLRGRARGRLAVVGIGPGAAGWRTPQASQLIAEAGELVGYGLYIDLLGPLAHGKTRTDFPLGAEEERCRHALERAGEGLNVALVCSGDAGIYAMGALVFELLDGDAALSDAARRVEVLCAPGISALQAAAARAGAPLGHDFCAISLSDLLTPREHILRRIRAAADGDFVVAFYNPVSRYRRTLLAEARDILLAARPAATPVLLATNLGRQGEEIRYRDLCDLSVDEVDMLTVVLVGSSQSRLVHGGDGARMYTPRGYARKRSGGQPPDPRSILTKKKGKAGA
ncbi:MAG: precorrin-3B C(17)-methyltransferase [Paracoccaceae bacterium]